MSDLFEELQREEKGKIERESEFHKNYCQLNPLISRFDKYFEKISEFDLDIQLEKELLYDFPYKDNFSIKEGVLYASDKEIFGEYNDPELKKVFRKAVKFDGLPVGLKITISNPTIRTNIILTILGSSCLLLFRKAVSADVTFETSDDYNEITKNDDNFRVVNEGMYEIDPNKFSEEDIENSFRYLMLKNPTITLSEGVRKKITENPTCYIATLIYRDINSKNICELRHFRDNYLIHHKLGKYFIQIYYKYSHKVVDKYKNNFKIQLLTSTILNFLMPFVKSYNSRNIKNA